MKGGLSWKHTFNSVQQLLCYASKKNNDNIEINLEWYRPIDLSDGREQKLIYNVNLDKVPTIPGIYVFGRCHGKSFEALYVGKATNIRSRVKQQIERNLRLMRHIEYARTGNLFLLIGEINTKPGQKLEKVLAITERIFIRHFLAEGNDLVNTKGTRIRRHKDNSSRKYLRKFIPQILHAEKARMIYLGHRNSQLTH